MDNKFLTYMQCNDVALFNEATQVLIDAKIKYESEDSNQFFDPSYANNEATRKIRLLIHPANFKKADDAFEKYYSKIITEIDKEYYLYQFSTDELINVALHTEEWGMMNSLLAKQILADKGITIAKTTIQSVELEKVFEAAEPEQASNKLLIIGYLFTLLFGFTGVIFGVYLLNAKKTLPDANQLLRYNNNTRLHAWIIIICSIIIFTIALVNVTTNPDYFNLPQHE
jgi:hypothetical protein